MYVTHTYTPVGYGFNNWQIFISCLARLYNSTPLTEGETWSQQGNLSRYFHATSKEPRST